MTKQEVGIGDEVLDELRLAVADEAENVYQLELDLSRSKKALAKALDALRSYELSALNTVTNP